jgi:hypothetical protein
MEARCGGIDELAAWCRHGASMAAHARAVCQRIARIPVGIPPLDACPGLSVAATRRTRLICVNTARGGDRSLVHATRAAMGPARGEQCFAEQAWAVARALSVTKPALSGVSARLEFACRGAARRLRSGH